MKKKNTAILVLAVGLTLSGCGTASTTPVQTPAAVSTSPAALTKLDNYVGKNLKETRKLLEAAGLKVTAKAADDKTILVESNWPFCFKRGWPSFSGTGGGRRLRAGS